MVMEEMYSGHNVVTSYNAVDTSKVRDFAYLNQDLHDSIWKSQFTFWYHDASHVLVGNLVMS